MSFWKRGKITSPKVHIEAIDNEGFTLIVDGEAFRVSFNDYPMFRGVPAEALQRFEVLLDEGVWWPELDEGIEFEALHHPERYPLVGRVRHKHNAAVG